MLDVVSTARHCPLSSSFTRLKARARRSPSFLPHRVRRRRFLLLRGRCGGGGGVGRRVVALARRVRGPECEIVTQQLHDQGAILVAVLVQGVQLGDGVVKCLKQRECKLKKKMS